MARPQQVGGLRKKAAEPGAGIFNAAIVDRYAERHVALAGRYAKMGEESREVGIGPLVVDNETAIDRRAVPVEGVAVTAETRGSLV